METGSREPRMDRRAELKHHQDPLLDSGDQRSSRSRASGASVPTARSHSRQPIEAYRHKHSQMESEEAPRQTKDMANPRTEATYNVEQTPPVFTTSNAQYGISEHEPRSKADVQQEPHAGLTRAEAAYHYYGNCFPRFERQRIRYNLDKEICEGTKVPDPALTLPALNTNLPILSTRSERSGNARNPMVTSAPQSTRSRRSAAAMSVRSGKTQTSVRSTGSRGGQWQTQAAAPPGWNPYRTHNAQYGQYMGSGDVPWPGGGREVWLLGRGGGQQSSFDSSLVIKDHMF